MILKRILVLVATCLVVGMSSTQAAVLLVAGVSGPSASGWLNSGGTYNTANTSLFEHDDSLGLITSNEGGAYGVVPVASGVTSAIGLGLLPAGIDSVFANYRSYWSDGAWHGGRIAIDNLKAGTYSLTVYALKAEGTATFNYVANSNGTNVSFAIQDVPYSNSYTPSQIADRVSETHDITVGSDHKLVVTGVEWTDGLAAIQLTAVPEPATLALLALGGLAAFRRRA